MIHHHPKFSTQSWELGQTPDILSIKIRTALREGIFLLKYSKNNLFYYSVVNILTENKAMILVSFLACRFVVVAV